MDYYPKHFNVTEWENDHQHWDLKFGPEAAVGNRMHVDHCIETLRLSLMCYADVTPMLIKPAKDGGVGDADFNTHHKCRNFQNILEWSDEHNYDAE